jgi:ABC-type glycerol-3-phosphate transport system substrate-binding protein
MPMDDINWNELERLVSRGQIGRRALLKHLLQAGGVAAVIGPGAALLAACGEPKKATGGPIPAGFPPVNSNVLGKKITLKILLAADYYKEAPFVTLFDQFQKAYPDITLDVSNAVWEDIPTKVKTAALGGAPIDVAHQHAFVYGHTGIAEPVDDLWDKWARMADFLPNSLQDVTWAGKRYGIPLDVNCLFTYYNKDLFTQYGATPPTATSTYTSLLAELLKFQGKPVKAIGLGNGGWDNSGLARANGGDLLKADETGVQINNPKVVAAIKWNSELGWKYKVGTLPAPTKRQDEAGFLFQAKQVALWFTGPWAMPDVKKSGVNFGTTELPKGMDGSTNGSVQGGGSLFIGKGSKNREAAFEFMKWCVAKPHQIRMAKEMARWPVIADVYSDPASIGANDPNLTPYFSQLRYAKPYKLEASPEGDRAWSDGVAAAYNGTDAQKALDDAQAKAPASIK